MRACPYAPGRRDAGERRPAGARHLNDTGLTGVELPMSVEFIGFMTNNNSSETIGRTGPVIDRPYLETVAKAHEVAGFDRALLAFHFTSPDCQQSAPHVRGITDRLKVLIAQRPGFTAPPLIARQLATIDQLSGEI